SRRQANLRRRPPRLLRFVEVEIPITENTENIEFSASLRLRDGIVLVDYNHRMPYDFDRRLEIYAELAVKIALNLQPGQRVMIIGPLASGGASPEAAPLIRKIAKAAYQAGAPLVEAIYGDEEMQLVRFKHAADHTFGEYSAWLPDALVKHVQGGHAILSVHANDPDLLKHENPDRVSTVVEATAREVRSFRELISRNQTNWAVIAAAGAGWATR